MLLFQIMMAAGLVTIQLLIVSWQKKKKGTDTFMTGRFKEGMEGIL